MLIAFCTKGQLLIAMFTIFLNNFFLCCIIIFIMDRIKGCEKLNIKHYILLLLKEGISSFNRTRLYASSFLLNLFSGTSFYKTNSELDKLSLDIKEVQTSNNITSSILKEYLKGLLNSNEDIKTLDNLSYPLEQVIHFINTVKEDSELVVVTKVISMCSLGVVQTPFSNNDENINKVFDKLVDSRILYKIQDGYILSSNVTEKQHLLFSYPL